MASAEICELGVAQLRRIVVARELSAREAVWAYLQRIEQLNDRLNAFLTVDADGALRAADQADAALRRGETPPLCGVPVAAKDLYATRGLKTTAGSKILSEWVPDHSATAVERLATAGAILLGKTNTHEFAFGATTVNPHYGATRNPWGLDRIAGGSSGGSAAAVASGLCAAALGTDTGGSIRCPAALTGTVGFKPSFGLVSRYGIFPLSWSLDHAGTISRTVEDAALLLEAIAGRDRRDPATLIRRRPALAHPSGVGMKGVRVGVLRELVEAPMQAEVSQAVRAAIGTLEKLGARASLVSYTHHAAARSAASLILFSEAAVIHQRWIRGRPGDFGPDVRARLQAGSLVPAALYLKAVRARPRLMAEAASLFDKFDVLVGPTVPISAPRLEDEHVWLGGRKTEARSALLRMTRSFNLLGLPALSVPCGFTRAGLPLGLQIVGGMFQDGMVLRVGHAYQEATEWRLRQPAL